jgi:hypothetical protein
MPFKSVEAYNAYKRDYMRGYRSKKRSLSSDKTGNDRVPTISPKLTNDPLGLTSAPHLPQAVFPNPSGGRKASSEIEDRNIFELIEKKEKIEALKARIVFASRFGPSDSSFWQWIRREYLGKCDALMKLQVPDQRSVTFLEQLKRDIEGIETLWDVRSEALDRAYLKCGPELDAIVTAVKNLRQSAPSLFRGS